MRSIKINFHDNVGMGNYKNKIKMIKAHDPMDEGCKALKFAQAYTGDIKSSNGRMYAIIESVIISCVDDFKKHSLKSYPEILNHPQSTTESVCFINFATKEMFLSRKIVNAST